MNSQNGWSWCTSVLPWGGRPPLTKIVLPVLPWGNLSSPCPPLAKNVWSLFSGFYSSTLSFFVSKKKGFDLGFILLWSRASYVKRRSLWTRNLLSFFNCVKESQLNKLSVLLFKVHVVLLAVVWPFLSLEISDFNHIVPIKSEGQMFL